MIENFKAKNLLSFDSVELNFNENLIIFTGKSGSGKSVLMSAILATFALNDSACKESVLTLGNGEDIDLIKRTNNEKIRFFLNDNAISKQSLKEKSKTFLKHLHLKNNEEFSQNNLLNLLDTFVEEDGFKEVLQDYKKDYSELISVNKNLEELSKKQENTSELMEFLSFEIKKIEELNPTEGEYETLLEKKKKLSLKDKLENSLQKAKMIFSYEDDCFKVLNILNKDKAFLSESLNELRAVFEEAYDFCNEEENIEKILNRLESISKLVKKYGSVEEALKKKEEKKQELEQLSNIEFSFKNLVKKQKSLEEKLLINAQKISKARLDVLQVFNENFNIYSKKLFLTNIKTELLSAKMHSLGKDIVNITLNSVSLDKISSGEFNRVRLALLTLLAKFLPSKKICLFLDEIDANLSGQESNQVALVLKELSVNYQIFAISHQAQLSSKASQHFLVDKINDKSFVKEIKSKERVQEIARMISGKEITKEAYEFALKMLKDSFNE